MSASTNAQRITVGQHRRVVAQPTAAVRNAAGSTDLGLTVWYPAEPGAETTSIDIGPAGDPYMRVGSVALDARFAGGGRRPVVLYSHGNNGSAHTTAWFGTALARAGYVVIAPDHPGNTLQDDKTPGGALLWWMRAGDLGTALDAVVEDPVLGLNIDRERVGVSGFSLGGMTALIALGGVFDGRLYDEYCLAHPGCTVAPAPEHLPIFDAEKTYYPDAVKAEIARMTDADLGLPAVKAGFIIAPATLGLRPETLRAITKPVTFIVGSEDAVATPDVGAALAASMIPDSKVVVVPGATHDSFINRCTEAGVQARHMECAQATEQELTHRMAIDAALDLFGRALA